MWLGEQITERGIGNGMSAHHRFSIIERLWPASFRIPFVQQQRDFRDGRAAVLVVVAVAAIAAVVG